MSLALGIADIIESNLLEYMDRCNDYDEIEEIIYKAEWGCSDPDSYTSRLNSIEAENKIRLNTVESLLKLLQGYISPKHYERVQNMVRLLRSIPAMSIRQKVQQRMVSYMDMYGNIKTIPLLPEEKE